jgi:hypothetical protein
LETFCSIQCSLSYYGNRRPLYKEHLTKNYVSLFHTHLFSRS